MPSKQLKQRIRELEQENAILLEEIRKLESPKLTMREVETLKLFPDDGWTITEFRNVRDVSYPVAFKIFKNLEAKGFIKGEWLKKGHKRKFFVTEK